jgi:[ribosomal protein S5]-alanine N-acetyltransferase
MTPTLDFPGVRLRRWHPHDVASLARHANNRKIWLNVRDHFPYPYTPAHAQEWIEKVAPVEPVSQFAIEVDGEAAGGVGITPQQDVDRYSAELGYWLDEAHWGRGIMTAVVRSVSEHAFAAFQLHRIYAGVFEWNPASCRVLEKAGFTFEGRLRRAAVKDGKLLDQYLYAMTRE